MLEHEVGTIVNGTAAGGRASDGGHLPWGRGDLVAEETLENGKIGLIKLLTQLGFAASNAEARRSIQQGAVKWNEEKWTDIYGEITPQDGDIIQVGKRKFARLKLS